MVANGKKKEDKMKLKFLKFLPLMTALMITASCGSDDNDPVTSAPTPNENTTVKTTGEETVAVPFFIKVNTGKSLTKEASLNQSIFKIEDIGTKMIVTSPDNYYSDVKGELDLTSENGLYYFEGSISCTSSHVTDLTEGNISLIGTYGKALEKPVSSTESFDHLFVNCNRQFKSCEFNFKSPNLTLIDQNTYLEIIMSKTQFSLDITSGENTVECSLGDGKVWVAVPSGKDLQVGSFLNKVASEVKPSMKHTINRESLVDLGIYGILWADHNVGATNPWDYGDYYAWGETTTKDDYSWSTYVYGSSNAITKYCNSDKLTTLESSDDVAYDSDKHLSMPTSQDLIALGRSCYWVWTDNYSESGINGYIVYKALDDNDKGKKIKKGQTSKKEYQTTDVPYIFLPSAGFRSGTSLYYNGSYGYYWSSSISPYNPDNAYRSINILELIDQEYYGYRYVGLTVRPVRHIQ